MRKLRPPLLLAAFLLLRFQGLAPTGSTCIPRSGCKVALGYYIVSTDDSLDSIESKFQTNLTSIQQYNQLSNISSIKPGQALSVPFRCSCVDDDLGHTFSYTVVEGDTVDNVVSMKFCNLSQSQQVLSASGITDDTMLKPGSPLKIPVLCSCGDPDVNTTYGMFLTYVVQAGDTLSSLSQKFGIPAELLSKYNGKVNMNNLVAYNDIIFVPAKDGNGVYPPFEESHSGGTIWKVIIAVAVVVVVVGAIVVMVCFFPRCRKNLGSSRQWSWFHPVLKDSAVEMTGPQLPPVPTSNPVSSIDQLFIEFPYDKLVQITHDPHRSEEIGRGGFGVVYKAEIENKTYAIKQMDSTKLEEFVAELKVLSQVRHTNIVISLACECTDEKPESRPNMTDIVARLSNLLPTTQSSAYGSYN